MTTTLCSPTLPIFPTDDLPLRTALVWDLYRYVGRRYPARIYARVMETKGGTCTLREVSWGELFRDSEEVAAAMRKRIPRAGKVSVGILGYSNYDYIVHVVACWLNKWTPLPLSTRNSPETCRYLLQSIDATALIVDSTFHSDARYICDSGLEIVLIPFHKMNMPDDSSLSVLGETEKDTVQLSHTLDDVVVYTHTSGSQGHPKTIPITHRHFLATTRSRSASAFSGGSVYAPLPAFHGMGLYSLTRWPLGSGVVPVLLDLSRPISIDVVSQHLQMLRGAVAFLPPSILEEAMHSHDIHFASLASARRVFFAGAPLRENVGEHLIRQGVKLASAYGMSEVSLLSALEPATVRSGENWQYVRLRDDSYSLEFRRVDNSAARELVVCPGADDAPSVINNTDPAGFATNDLWLPHPTEPGLWKYLGRKDSLTVLSTGEKTDDKELENLILLDDRIARVIVYGSGKPYNGVVLQLSPAVETSKISIDDIWPTIEHANSLIPRHSRLIRNMIIIADVHKPFVLSDKGTVRKVETLALYEDEIIASYDRPDRYTMASGDLGTFSHNDVRNYMRECIAIIKGEELSDDQDLFDAGLDSLHALQIRAAAMHALSRSGKVSRDIPLNIAYTYPTIAALTKFIVNCIHGGYIDCDTPQSVDAIQRSVQRFSQGLPNRNCGSGQPSASSGHVVVLTGSTGSLGCHVLKCLLNTPDVRLIYCFTRKKVGSDAVQKQAFAMAQRGIEPDILTEAVRTERLLFYPIDLVSPDLSLEEHTVNKIRKEVTHIIHAAWHLDFNWPLDRFEPVYVAGTRHLIDLALSSLRPSPRFVFISSVGAIGGYDPTTAVPEKAIDDPRVASSQGYGRAKYVCERLLVHASQSGLQVAIVRAGQLSGSTQQGVWTLTEHIPMLLSASLVLKKVPEDLPPLRWLPVDVAADAITHLSLRPEQQQISIYHIENSSPTPWTEAMNMLIEAAGVPLEVVPNTTWLEALQQQHNGRAIPAAALLHFYSEWLITDRRWVMLDVKETSTLCPALHFGKVTPELIRKYVQYIMKSTRDPG
ncbi:acetyl-CoA synthetase-like protein [Neolentinus lepideus HHB14362 ss-1]|uniref:Acetyl-CoA synthetase-like protein n=1 Tax=Neolentinus lepideus HHB14362 ss-1 TaxID=1314782 RepID=A0A165SYD9_9AGAM|nr:acetyl-CoA synthetase-like protein [Neolentinus lepideus HHB14362 ss-1]